MAALSQQAVTPQSPNFRPNDKKACPHCGRAHGGTECWKLVGKCLKCGITEHQIRDCPRLQQGVQRGAPAPAAPVTGRPGRPRAQAQVFALARENAEQAENVTEGFRTDRNDCCADEILEVDKYHWLGWRGLLPVLRSYQDSSLYCLGDGLWRAMVGVVLRLGRMSRGVRRGVSSRPQGPTVLPPPPPVDYGVFMQGLVQAMQMHAQTQAALQAQLQAHAQAPAPVPQKHGHSGLSVMERFKSMAPASFKGESQPLLAESWIREVEKIFHTIRCVEEDKGMASRGRRSTLAREDEQRREKR
ncbi:hypothetical protein Taro_053125, partial [Colocasia esculenta]|nr:hypothetical protein [Colocasia esculenta]